MAFYKYPKHLHQNNGNAFDVTYGPGEEVEFSGIYRCDNCGREAACNKGDGFPPHNPNCEDIAWRLLVAVEN